MALGEKWSSASPSCVFRRYFYNHVGENRAPYYRPSPGEDERKWEEALAKKPGPGYIPVLGVGFEQLGIRLSRQVEYLAACNVRLHEINDALTAMLHKHELIISVRILEARRKHQTLSHRCLVLATKVQVLRNRGYAMSGDEEELKRKLVNLERGVFDPALGGRSEEIWARMVSIRERTRALHEEMERSVKGLMNGQPEMLDEEVMKKAAKASSSASTICFVRAYLLTCRRCSKIMPASSRTCGRSSNRFKGISRNGRTYQNRIRTATQRADRRAASIAFLVTLAGGVLF